MVCLVFAGICASDDSSAESTTETSVVGGVTYTLTDGAVSITAYDETVKAVTIKSKVTLNNTEYSLTSVPNGIFSGKGIETLTVEEGITTIAESAFSGCKSLTSISIPCSVTTIGKSAFKDCDKLSTFNLATSDESSPHSRTIGEYAFQNCTALTSVPSHKSLKLSTGCYSGTGLISLNLYSENCFVKKETLCLVPEELCNGCVSLETFTICISDGITSVTFKNNCFNGCIKLTQLPDLKGTSLTKITFNTGCFKDSGITSISVSASEKITLTMAAFQGCASLTQAEFLSSDTVFTYSGSPIPVEQSVFKDCVKLSKLKITGMEVFHLVTIYNCPLLKSFSLDLRSNQTIQGLDQEDFLKNTYLEEIDISTYLSKNSAGTSYNPEGKDKLITQMSGLLSIPTLKKLTLTGENSFFCMVDGALYYKPLESGKVATPGTPTALVLCSPDVESLKIPSTVTEISAYAFNSCKNLKLVEFPAGLTKYSYAGTDVKFVSYTGTDIDTSDLENFKGVTFATKDGVTGLAMCPVVTFTADGMEVGKVTYVWGTTTPIDTPANPTTTNKNLGDFEGWYTDAEYTTKYDASIALTKDTTVYAKFKVVSATVNLVEDGKILKSYENIAEGKTITLQTSETKGFEGWSINGLLLGAQYTVSLTDADTTGNITLTAKIAEEVKTTWDLKVSGTGIDGKVFCTASNLIGTYGMITVLPGEFEEFGYDIKSANAVVGEISDSCLMVSSKDGKDVEISIEFKDVGKAAEYTVSIAEITADGKSGFRATLTADDGGYIDTDGTLAIGYVYKVYNETEKAWVYTTSGSTEGVTDCTVEFKDKAVKTEVFSGDFTLDKTGAYLVYGYAKYSYKDASATSTTVTVTSPVIVSFVSTVQAVIGKS